jgi:hypothetical protein
MFYTFAAVDPSTKPAATRSTSVAQRDPARATMLDGFNSHLKTNFAR